MTPELRDTCFDRNVERSLVGLSVLDDPLSKNNIDFMDINDNWGRYDPGAARYVL